MVKLVQQQMGPLFASAFPILTATVLLALVVGPRDALRFPRADLVGFLLLGILGQVIAQLCITWGVRLSVASNAALISLALPISTAVMAHFILGERMNTIRWVSFALAIAGVLACSGIDWRELNLHSSQFLVGNLLIFASVNGSAFYNTYSKKMLSRHSPLQLLLYSYYAGLLLLLPLTVWREPTGFRNLPHYTLSVWLGLVILAVFQYFLSMLIFLKVLTRLDATQAALCNYLIPFFGVLIAAVVLGERLTSFMVAGGILALASTLLITIFDREESGTAIVQPINDERIG